MLHDCLFTFFRIYFFTEFIQPQHLWPYIQQNLIQQNHLTNPAFITSHSLNPHHQHPPHHQQMNGNSNNNNNNNSENNSIPNSPEEQARDNKVIAKPLPSRPTPFIHHGLNHPHLHSLLAHCRNPYISGK